MPQVASSQYHARLLAALDIHGRVARFLAPAREYDERLMGAAKGRVNRSMGYLKERGTISLNKTTAKSSAVKNASLAALGRVDGGVKHLTPSVSSA